MQSSGEQPPPSKRQAVCVQPPGLPFLPEEIWLLVLGRVADETTKAICMLVCHDWRLWVLMLTRSVVPRLFAEDLACSVPLLLWQRDFLGRPFNSKTCR